MPAYLVVAVTYSDKSWTEAYRRDVPAMMAKYGGSYVAKSLNPERIEGVDPDPDTLAVTQFPSVEAIRTFLASDEYRPYAEARQAGSATQMYLIEG